MIDLLKSLFAAPEDDRRAIDATQALAALLVEIARIDDDYADAEREVIDRILAQRFGLPPARAAALRERGEQAQATATDLHRFAESLRQTLDHQERIAAMELFWDVALADGVRDEAEDARLRLIAGLMHVPDQESALARRRAAMRQGLS